MRGGNCRVCDRERTHLLLPAGCLRLPLRSLQWRELLLVRLRLPSLLLVRLLRLLVRLMGWRELPFLLASSCLAKPLLSSLLLMLLMLSSHLLKPLLLKPLLLKPHLLERQRRELLLLLMLSSQHLAQRPCSLQWRELLLLPSPQKLQHLSLLVPILNLQWRELLLPRAILPVQCSSPLRFRLRMKVLVMKMKILLRPLHGLLPRRGWIAARVARAARVLRVARAAQLLGVV